MIAWVLRFALFGMAGNTVTGFILIITSCIVYGMAFDFFNISGALFVEQNTDSKITASAQGLFMLMTNGIGAVLGNLIAGQVIRHWFEDPATLVKDWPGIWMTFASYALVVAILFSVLFRHKHVPEETANISH